MPERIMPHAPSPRRSEERAARRRQQPNSAGIARDSVGLAAYGPLPDGLLHPLQGLRLDCLIQPEAFTSRQWAGIPIYAGLNEAFYRYMLPETLLVYVGHSQANDWVDNLLRYLNTLNSLGYFLHCEVAGLPAVQLTVPRLLILGDHLMTMRLAHQLTWHLEHFTVNGNWQGQWQRHILRRLFRLSQGQDGWLCAGPDYSQVRTSQTQLEQHGLPVQLFEVGPAAASKLELLHWLSYCTHQVLPVVLPNGRQRKVFSQQLSAVLPLLFPGLPTELPQSLLAHAAKGAGKSSTLTRPMVHGLLCDVDWLSERLKHHTDEPGAEAVYHLQQLRQHLVALVSM